MRLADLKKGRSVPGDSGAPMDKPPEWMDFDRFHRGRRFFEKHIAAILLYLNCSLAAGMSLENILGPLVFNNRSDTPKKAFVRYYKTFLHITLWHVGDVWEFPLGKAHKSVRMIRNMHKSVFDRMNDSSERNGDQTKQKLFVNQYDMAMVQMAFFWPIITKPENYGIKSTDEELNDYIFFWRCIGYLLGIQDEYNICSVTLDECRAVGNEGMRDVLIPALRDPPKDFERMADAYVAGTNVPAMFDLMSRDALISYFMYALGYEIPKLGFLDVLRLNFIKFVVFLVRWLPGFETFSNYMFMKQYHTDLHLLKL